MVIKHLKKILLSGEGKSDYGIDDGMGNWKEGPVQVFMRRCRPLFSWKMFIPSASLPAGTG